MSLRKSILGIILTTVLIVGNHVDVFAKPEIPDEYMEVGLVLSDEVWDACVSSGEEFEIAPEYLAAIGWRETRWRNIDSPDGKYKGVMQIYPGSHQSRMARLGVTDLHNISDNVRVAANYLRELLDQYEDPVIALVKYHGESGDGSNSSYVHTIMKLSNLLEEE